MKSFSVAVFLIIGLMFIFSSISSAKTFEVAITDEGFVPSSLNIYVGDTVRWTNHGMERHSAFRPGHFDTGELSPHDSNEFIFTVQGKFEYMDWVNMGNTAQIWVFEYPVSISPGDSILHPTQKFDLVFHVVRGASKIQVILDGSEIFDGDYDALLSFIKSFDGARELWDSVVIPFSADSFKSGVHHLTLKVSHLDDREFSDTVTYRKLSEQVCCGPGSN
jgi:plastocyanin